MQEGCAVRHAPARWKSTNPGSGFLIRFFEQSCGGAGLLVVDSLLLFQQWRPFPYQRFRIAVQVDRFSLNLVTAAKHDRYHPAGRGLQFEALLPSFETQNGADPRDMNLGPELKPRARGLLHQLFRELAGFEFFGPWRNRSRAMLI